MFPNYTRNTDLHSRKVTPPPLSSSLRNRWIMSRKFYKHLSHVTSRIGHKRYVVPRLRELRSVTSQWHHEPLWRSIFSPVIVPTWNTVNTVINTPTEYLAVEEFYLIFLVAPMFFSFPSLSHSFQRFRLFAFIFKMPRKYYAECLQVSTECPVEATVYGYYPNLGANALFAAIFGILLIAQIIIGTRTRTWTFLFVVGLGVFGEMVGYVGRIMMHKNPWSQSGFETQICCLVLAPSFLAAGIYLTLKHMVLYCGPEYSRLKAKWYPWIFIGSDLGSIIVQAIGGGVAASANHGANKALLNAGDALIIAGITLQSITMLVCGTLVLDFFLRRRRARTANKTRTEGSMSLEATTLTNDVHTRSPLRFRIFCWSTGFAFLTILIRCLYRIPEMAGGWGNKRMRQEPAFLILDGTMIALASIAFTVSHPGIMFPPMRRKKKGTAAPVSDASS